MDDNWRSGPKPIEGEYKVLEEREVRDTYPPSGSGGYLEVDPNPPYVTYVLLGLNIAMWLLMTLAGMLLRLNLNQQLLLFGAKVNVLIAQGQYWRLFTAMFLHIGIMHLFFNSYALYLYGPVVEKLFGKQKFILVYLLSGLMGSLFSYLFSPNPAAGASGAIFGLMGSLLYFRQRKRDVFQRIFGPGLLIIIGINLFYGFVQPGIDNWGHIGGLVGGFILGNAVGLYRENRYLAKRILLFILLTAIFATGMWYGQQVHGSGILLDRAISSLREGDLASAEVHAIKAAKGTGNPQEVKQVLEAVYLTKAKEYANTADYSSALKAVNSLLDYYVEDTRYRLYRAAIFEELRNYEGAFLDYAFVLEKESATVQLLYLAGQAAYYSGRPAEARDLLTRALELSPNLRQARDLLQKLDTSI